MRTCALSVLLFCSLMLEAATLPSVGGGQELGVSAGFSEAVYDASTLREIMGRSGCTGLRLYNVKRDKDDATGSTMVIGITADGAEQYAWLGPKYQLFMGLDGGRVSLNGLSASSAYDACVLMRTSGGASYSADFMKADVERLLGTAGCNGLKVMPAALQDGTLSMRLVPVNIRDGRAEEVASGGEQLCTQPCPTFCGGTQNYVNTPR